MPTRGEFLQSEVLRILAAASEPLSAYDILDEMHKSDSRIAPTTVYRTLATLSEKRSVLRLETLKAYVLRHDSCADDASILSICDDCGFVEEKNAPDLVDSLSSLLGETGFAAQRHVIEVHGTCGTCVDEKETKG